MLIMLCCATGIVKAQFSSSSEIDLYVHAGESLESNPYLSVCAFSNGCAYYLCYTSNTVSNLRKKYQKDPTLLSELKTSDGRWKDHYKYRYDSSNSTSKRVTYHRHDEGYNNIWGNEPPSDTYLSFSPDRESLIVWSGNNGNKTYYQRVKLSEIAPKSINKDFLYE